MSKIISDEFFYQEAKKYVEFSVEGKTFNIPYMINDGSRYCSPKLKGKGSANQIREEFIEVCKSRGITINNLTNEEARNLMIELGLGVDCSGFVYNILDSCSQRYFNKSIDKFVKKYSGLVGEIEKFFRPKNRVTRINAQTLLSHINSVQVVKSSEIIPGDMISLTSKDWPTKHIALVVKNDLHRITYAHSSDTYCETSGVHFAEILIKDKNLGLEHQNWLEHTADGKNYGVECYLPNNNDGVRRIKYFKNRIYLQN